MPIRGCGCSGGLWATALVAFLALPVQYYVPDFLKPKENRSAETLLKQPNPPSTDYFYWISLENLPVFDLFLTIFLLVLATFTYLCDWIQRKLMERRIIKLNQYLSKSVEQMRAWDARQEQLQSTLRMVQTATSEYNLLLFLLLRQHRQLGAHAAAPAHCFCDKQLDDLTFTRSPNIDV